jgi:hypothetical protein
VFAYKFVAACVGVILGVTVVVALARPSAETDDVMSPKAAKLDVSRIQPDMECPKIAWPYGCEWHPPIHTRNKHVLVQQRRHPFSVFE